MNTGLVACRTRLDALENAPSGLGSGAFGSGLGSGASGNIGLGSAPFAGLNTGGGVGGQSYVIQMDINTAKADIEAGFQTLKASMASLGASLGSGGGGHDPRLTKALERLGDLEGCVTGEAFAMGNYVFCSRTEVAEWIVNKKVPSAGVFWDLFSVLVCMKPKRQTGKDRSDESHSSKRTGSTILENDLAASMTHVRPELLYSKKGSGELGRLESGFCACPTYSTWITGTECFRGQMTDMLEKFLNGVQGATKQSETYYVLVLLLATNVRAQWHKLCAFVDSFYIELTGVSGFAGDKAWALVGWCVAALFGALQPHRSPVTMLEDLGTLENKAACIWAVLQCHRVGGEFDLVAYRGHPAVVKEMSLFMLTERVDPGEMEKLSAKAKSAERDAAEAKAETLKAKAQIVDLNRDFKTLRAEFAALKAKKS
jgi:hypothetical protein